MKRFTLITLVLLSGAAQAASEKVEMNLVTAQAVGQSIGTITVEETDKGLKFTPDLKALPAGSHGFHVHEKGSCSPAMKDGKAVAGGAAGEHYDPHKTGKHLGPEGEGHAGDLPPLVVDASGKATEAVVAPHLMKLDDIKGRALMVHVGGDNFSDTPKPLGGGGARFACGVVN